MSINTNSTSAVARSSSEGVLNHNNGEENEEYRSRSSRCNVCSAADPRRRSDVSHVHQGFAGRRVGSRHIHTCANARILQTATRLQFLNEPPTGGCGLLNKEKYNERFSRHIHGFLMDRRNHMHRRNLSAGRTRDQDRVGNGWDCLALGPYERNQLAEINGEEK